jgi:hypothetical protein
MAELRAAATWNDAGIQGATWNDAGIQGEYPNAYQ